MQDYPFLIEIFSKLGDVGEMTEFTRGDVEGFRGDSGCGLQMIAEVACRL